ncbi:MAG: CNNM domain-containing protein [Woeseiaceae bacterium]|nr:CNNM domain-containing protein [Woeseiaceae bacterium]
MSDDMPLEYLFVILAILILLSAFFSGTETALMRVNKYRVRHLAKKGNKSAKLAEKLLKKPEKLIAFILLGTNLVNFIAASLVGVVSMEIGGPTGVVVGTILLTAVVLLFCESIPKTVAAIFPEKIALPASRIYHPLVKFTQPFLAIINFFTNMVLKFLGSSPNDQEEKISVDELKTIITDGLTKTAFDRQNIMMGVLDLGSMTVEDIMLPHNEVVGIDLTESKEKNIKIIQKNFHSSLPVYEDDLDNIKGVLSLNHFLMNADLDSFSNDLVKQHMKRPYFIPETTSLSQQLVEFKSNKQKTAFAVDEYGNIQGLITIEDIFEEIVGDYLDETEKLNKEIKPKKIDDYYVVNASSNIRVLNKMMNWSIPIDEAKTINGAVLDNLGYIPDVGTDFRLGGYSIEILSTKENAVEKVKIKKTDDDYELKVVS